MALVRIGVDIEQLWFGELLPELLREVMRGLSPDQLGNRVVFVSLFVRFRDLRLSLWNTCLILIWFLYSACLRLDHGILCVTLTLFLRR